MKGLFPGISAGKILQYIAGLLLMSFGIVTIQQCCTGVSPTSALPCALSVVTGVSFGLLTSLFNCLCVLIQIIIVRRLRIEHALQFVLAWVFGYLIDMFVSLYGALCPDIAGLNYLVRIGICCAGIVVQALGITVILGAELLLPPGDSLVRTVSTKYSRDISFTKIVCDFMWVGVSLMVLAVGLLLRRTDFAGILQVISLGTILSAYGNGKCIALYRKLFPGLMPKGAN